MLYLAVKYLHVIGAAVLLGTGAGIAFFMLIAHIRADTVVIAGVARIVVLADFLFTATAVADHRRLADVYLGLFVRGRLDRTVDSPVPARGTPLPPRYHRLFWLWFAFGFPAFGAVLGIFWLMIAKPAISLF
jgi:uncharacterized membrane protein